MAIATDYARRRYNLTKVAVIDFDVHHGNGTQLAFQNDGDLMFGSSHQYPFYPGTGSISEEGVGNIWNAPLKALSGSIEFRAAMQERIFPALRMHKPELIIISAGVDALRDDPLGAFPLLDDEGNCVQEEVATDDSIIPDTTTNVYYWCILPLAIILVVLFFSLMAREREKQLKTQ